MIFTRQYLEHHPTVLAVGFGGETILSMIDANLEGVDIRQVEEAEWDRTVSTPGVVCVLVRATTDRHRDEEWSIRDIEKPTIVLSKTHEEELAARTATAGGTYIPLSETTVETVVELVQQKARRGEAATDRSFRRNVFESFLTSYDAMMYLKNRAGQYVAAATYKHRPNPEVLYGRTDAELAREQENEWNVLEKTHRDEMSVMESGEPIRSDIEQYGSGEAAFWYERTIHPWTDEAGEPRGVVSIIREASGWKREQREMQQRIEQLERFTSFVSHDLRSPLQIADGYLEMARTGDPDAFERISESNRRMGELIDDLETLVSDDRVDDTGMGTTRLVDLAEEVWEVLNTGSATLVVELPEPTIVTATASEIRPILENLFKNALEHGSTGPDSQARQDAIDHGGANVTVWLGSHNDGFYVEDDGPGIPESEHDKIFEEGYTTADDGTGIGLAIVTDAIDRLKWEVTARSGRAGGARIAIGNCPLATEPSPAPLTDRSLELIQNRDVGETDVDGAATYDDETGEWMVIGAGDDMYADNTEFHYVYATVEGPVSVQARLLALEDLNHYSKAGVIVRDSADDGATHGYVGRTPGHGVETTWRREHSGQTVSQQLESSPDDVNWLRVDRIGEQITCYVSRDGETWRTVDQRSVSLSDPVTVGLAVCSVVPRALCTARFDDVAVRPIEDGDQ